MDKVDLKTILHVLNTFPKAFLIWGILEQRTQRPVDMEAKLNKEFSWLKKFTFLNRKNFAQYCHRSLKDIVYQDSIYCQHNRTLKEYPAWGLIDTSIQPIAGFMLAKCAQLEVNCETFLAKGKNSSPKFNFDRIQVLLDLFQNGKQQFSPLKDIRGGWDNTGKARHLTKLAKTGLIEHTTFSSKENHIGYKWVADKNINQICYGNDDGRADKYKIAIRKISEILPNANRAIGPSELAYLSGYVSESYIKGALRLLYKQGFVVKLSKCNHSLCRISKKGQAIVRHIINPLILGFNEVKDPSTWFSKIEPGQEDLMTVMDIYAKSLKSKR